MLKRSLIFLLAVLVIFEEWLWDVLADIGIVLERYLHIERFERWLVTASPKQALFSFIIPIAVVTPFNILAVVLLAHGAIVQAILLEIVVKLVGTLLIARIFKLVKPALLTFGWFKIIYDQVTAVLKWAKERVYQTSIYQLSVALKIKIREKVQHFFVRD